jgi:small subunit ribosomal protein S16
VSEKRSKLVGKMIDDLGFYNPLSKPEEFEIDTKKVAYWQEKGASISDSVKNLLEKRLV